MPHKAGSACERSTRSTLRPRALSSVNTVVLRDDGSTFGASTDGAGFVDWLQASGVDGRGTAGRRCSAPERAARSIVDALGRAGAADIAIVNRNAESAERAARGWRATARVGWTGGRAVGGTRDQRHLGRHGDRRLPDRPGLDPTRSRRRRHRVPPARDGSSSERPGQRERTPSTDSACSSIRRCCNSSSGRATSGPDPHASRRGTSARDSPVNVSRPVPWQPGEVGLRPSGTPPARENNRSRLQNRNGASRRHRSRNEDLVDRGCLHCRDCADEVARERLVVSRRRRVRASRRHVVATDRRAERGKRLSGIDTDPVRPSTRSGVRRGPTATSGA